MATEIHPYVTTSGLSDQLGLTTREIKNGGYLHGGIWFKDTKTIVCGTFPPKTEYNKRKGYAHYSSNRNQFWRHFDAIFNTCLYQKLYNDKERIKSAKKKIELIRAKGIGFVDVFTQVNRDSDKAQDRYLKPVETIFDTGTFNETLKKSVCNYIFVYSFARDTFKHEIKKKFQDAKFQLVQKRTADNIPEILSTTIKGKTLFLTYSPIHGGIKKERKRDALKLAFGKCRKR